MPEHALRFGVAAPSGLRAESWKCWTQSGTGKSDVYVSCRALGSSLKLSLHESGRWHVGFDSNRFAEMFETESAPADRFAGKFDCPAPLIEDLTLACRISVPWHAATISGPIKDKGIHWVDPAPRGQAVEFNVFLLKRPPDATDWPGKDAMRTGLVGHLPSWGQWVRLRRLSCMRRYSTTFATNLAAAILQGQDGGRPAERWQSRADVGDAH